MRADNGSGFRFGLEAEYLLATVDEFRPLWHRDVRFEDLNTLLEAIPVEDLPPLDGLDLEPPHRKRMPYAVEGYHVPDPDLNPIDLLPKGVEIRTPVCQSIDECLRCLVVLFDRLQTALKTLGYTAVALSHHPTEYHFQGPQNKRRYDFWQWAMEVMVTYGPDINISLPTELNVRLDPADLHAKVNYYAPGLAALSLASPLCRGGLWNIRGQVGKSLRTHRRSVIAPAIELHPEEGGRLEFKVFEMPCRLEDFEAYFLLWLTVVLDDGLRGRAGNQTRIYDLGHVARVGLHDNVARCRASEVLDRAVAVLARLGFNTAALDSFGRRVETRRTPADDIIDAFDGPSSLAAILRSRSRLHSRSRGGEPIRSGSV